MKSFKKCLTVLMCLLAFVAVSATRAAASEIVFADLQSVPGIPSLFIDFTSFGIASLNLTTPFDPSDPFATSSPGSYTQLQPLVGGVLPALFIMDPVGPTGPADASGTTPYGPGSFSIGINGGTNSIPWVTGTFTSATLQLAADLSTGVFQNSGGTTFAGLGFDISGLMGPGSFAFALANPTIFDDAAGAPVGIGYEITNGALAAQETPEPASLLLLGSGLALLRRRRRS